MLQFSLSNWDFRSTGSSPFTFVDWLDQFDMDQTNNEWMLICETIFTELLYAGPISYWFDFDSRESDWWWRLGIQSMSDSCLCCCALRWIIIPSFIDNLMSGTNLMTHCVDSIEIPASIEFIDGFYDFVSLHEIRFAANSHLRQIEDLNVVIDFLRLQFQN